jgi:hypothetical protein
MMKKEKIMKIM